MNTTSSVSEILTNTKTLNTNSVSVNKINNTKTLNQVRLTASVLAEKLRNPSRFKFYCKVAWSLPENVIWNHLETAQRGRDPQKYFSWLCNHSMAVEN